MPHARHDTIESIDLGALGRRGIKTLLIDLDNTLVAYRAEEATRAVQAWVQQAQGLGLTPIIFSNNNSRRVGFIAEKLEVSYISEAKKPFKKGYRRALEVSGGRSESVAAVGDQLFTDILGGNRAGFMTILVKPIGQKEFIGTRCVRIIEKMVLKRLRPDVATPATQSLEA